MRTKSKAAGAAYIVVFVAGFPLVAGCVQQGAIIQESVAEAPIFSYDEAALPAAKPWTSENFRNNPGNFQFAIVGDRTGGANVEGTFDLAVDQLNLMQPEFVINVGDMIEGYSDDPADLNAEWDGIDDMLGRLEMPLFRTGGVGLHINVFVGRHIRTGTGNRRSGRETG